MCCIQKIFSFENVLFFHHMPNGFFFNFPIAWFHTSTQPAPVPETTHTSGTNETYDCHEMPHLWIRLMGNVEGKSENVSYKG
jgi:hypothetical protein